jgi:hypothetical protein
MGVDGRTSWTLPQNTEEQSFLPEVIVLRCSVCNKVGKSWERTWSPWEGGWREGEWLIPNARGRGRRWGAGHTACSNEVVIYHGFPLEPSKS